MIKIKDLSFSYTGGAPYILNDINLQIKSGDYISLLGENGSGKSTLIKLVLKLIEPVKGSITYDSAKIGYVPQRFENLNTQFPMTVYEMLNAYRKTLKIKHKDVIINYLDIVKMADFKNALIGTLSGGQFQKMFIARALLGSPDLLIFDEPSTGVDAKSQDEIYALIKNLNRESGITVISAEHNLKAAISNSTLIYHLHEGHGHLCSPSDYISEYVKSNTGGEADV